ncbi:MAG: hypothetical protein Q7R61_01695 [bacterium]|nr:hypothetical protein [bacterium]MDP3771103.1 hypothetical protein [bacterium]
MKKDNKKGDYILITAAVLLLILSGFFVFLFPFRRFEPKALVLKVIGEASLTIDFGNGEKRVFKGEVVDNENLLNVLNQAAKAGNLRYKLDGENNVAAIETFTMDKTKTWQWRINGKKVEKPLYEIIVKPNDEILIKYE